MPKLTIDGNEIEVPVGFTVIQACEQAGIEIPRFCYHERLSVAGNCRMCLVEVKPGPPKPAASCAMPVSEGMEVRTNTPMVKKAREGVMEFLLINHPLDCPICDQGGECDLQDQSMAYGKGLSRYVEDKRAVKDKYMGPLVKTQMTRCIHCTRCIRFAEEIAGVPELGATGRGEHMEVGTYVEKTLTSELSGNIIDLCPVGALTSRPYAFHARPWELRKVESIDVLDAVGSNIRIDARGREVLRVLPRLNEDVNEEWISDKTRFACDGLKTQRLDRPYVRRHGKLEAASWEDAFSAIADKLRMSKPERIGGIAGDLMDAESLLAFKELLQSLGTPNMDCRQDGMQLGSGTRASWLFNTGIAGIEQADFCLIIGANPRHEAALVNARLRKRFLRGGFTVANIGTPLDLTFPVLELGDDPRILEELAVGTHPLFQQMQAAKNPMLMLGTAALNRGDSPALIAAAQALASVGGMLREDWNGYNILHTVASRVAGLDLGLLPEDNGLDVAGMLAAAQNGQLDVLFLLGADEIDTRQLGKTFVVYQGHHGDAGAHRADVILPGAAYTEKDGTYTNLEGRVQQAQQVVTPPGEAREDWKILRALSQHLGQKLPYDTLAELRAHLQVVLPIYREVGYAIAEPHDSLLYHAETQRGQVSGAPFVSGVENFYMTDPISRASRTMAACTEEILGGNPHKTARAA